MSGEKDDVFLLSLSHTDIGPFYLDTVVYLCNVNVSPVSHTWCENNGCRYTFQMALSSEDTDIVLHPEIQVL